MACILAAALCACSSPGGQEQSGKKKSEEQKEEVEEKAQGPVVEEQVLYEKDGVRITAKELKVEEMEDYSWATLNLLLENEGSEDIVCEMNAMLVNHYEMNSGPLHVPQTVPAGKRFITKRACGLCIWECQREEKKEPMILGRISLLRIPVTNPLPAGLPEGTLTVRR